ncbi:penicillin acylase family protein (plasmid) [Natrinema zhouii]|uniref:penicillin acylase family protein n=1 Tax=Natrinema zhouii TaxID=1710539 RepID=UPI001CFF5E1B|nr:penicillin acylase family protein [Natrinema zhouii]UHQ98979.1 penicillin acylase family protein [Natrinema zhouii]
MLRASTAVAGAAGISAVAQTELAYAKSAGQTTTVTIKRDEYGVPHIYAREADSRAPVFYGFGYATAKDRLYQLELYKRYYRGTVAEVIGEGDENNDWVQFDKEARRNTAGEQSLDKQAEKQMTSEQRKMLQAFTDGINRYIREVHNSDDREFHKGFSDNDFEPEEFSFADSAGMFVSTMSYFSGTQLETLGAALVDALERETGSRERAMELFRDCNWGDDPGAPTSTVQPEVGYHPPYVEANSVSKSAPTYERRGKTGKLNDSTNKVTGGNTTTPANAQKVHETEMDRIQTLASGLDDLGLAMKYGSNALAVQGELTESGDALLFGGPQMGFNTPSVMYEAGLHGPDFDVTGSTVAGYPFIMFGHNQNGAFTSTAGLDNSIQTFVESITVNEDGPDTYTFRGDEHEIETEEKTIAVKDGDDVTYTERFTRHGVITTWDPENDQAIAQTRSYAGKHMRCLRAYLEAQLAGGVDEFEEAAQRCDYSLNFFWAGKCGDIGYFHLGRYPDAESVEWDTRLPADGTQYELTDDDYLRAADGEVPHAINPAPGYIANWNNKPAPNWDSGDLSYFWSTHHRVQRIINLVEHSLEENGSVNYELLKEIIYDISFVDRRALRYKPHLLSALDDAELDEIEQQAKAELESWENYRQGEGEDFTGKYTAGFTIWDATFPKIIEEVFSDDFGQAYELASNFLNYSYGQGTLMRVLHSDEAALTPNVDYVDGDPDDELIAAFRSAVSELSDTYDGAPSSWRTEARIADLNNMALFGMPIGVSDAGDMPWVNRGTENHIVQLSDDPKAENVLPPGNDGYIAPDGTTGEHYNDQLQLFIDFEYKQLLFADEEVNAATESTREIVVWPEDSPDNRSDDAPGNRSHDDTADGTPGFTAVTGAGAVLGSALLWLRRRTGGR